MILKEHRKEDLEEAHRIVRQERDIEQALLEALDLNTARIRRERLHRGLDLLCFFGTFTTRRGERVISQATSPPTGSK